MKLLGIGGAHIDRRGQVAGDYVAAASNPGTMREDVGGGTLNALRNAAQRGVECTLISIRGGDGTGETVARAAAQANILDLSVTFLDRSTPSYTALLDREGELIAGFADMGLYDLAFPKQMSRSMVREAIQATEAILCDANVPAAGLEKIAALAQGKPIFAIGVSPAKVVRLASVLPAISCAFLNRREAMALTGAADWQDAVAILRDRGLESCVMTAGSEPVIGFFDDRIFTLEPPPPRRIEDVTGAGDALAGATISAMLGGKSLPDALRSGVAASILAIESRFTVPDLERQAFDEVLALVPEPQPVT